VRGCCEWCNELSSSIKWGEFVDWLMKWGYPKRLLSSKLGMGETCCELQLQHLCEYHVSCQGHYWLAHRLVIVQFLLNALESVCASVFRGWCDVLMCQHKLQTNRQRFFVFEINVAPQVTRYQILTETDLGWDRLGCMSENRQNK